MFRGGRWRKTYLCNSVANIYLQARPQKAECQEWLGLASEEAEEPPASR
jgi:hypothetical protein